MIYYTYTIYNWILNYYFLNARNQFNEITNYFFQIPQVGALTRIPIIN